MLDRILYLKDELRYPFSDQDIIEIKMLINICDKARHIVLKHNIVPQEQIFPVVMDFIIKNQKIRAGSP